MATSSSCPNAVTRISKHLHFPNFPLYLSPISVADKTRPSQTHSDTIPHYTNDDNSQGHEMALLTNGGASMKIPTAPQQILGLTGNSNGDSTNSQSESSADDYFLSNLISALPCWDNPAASITKPLNGLSKSPPG